MHKRKLENVHRHKRNKTLKAHRENKNKRGRRLHGQNFWGVAETHGGSKDQDRIASSQKERPAEV